MDVGLQHVAERGIHGTMPCQWRHAIECRADDSHLEVPAAITGTGMAGMTVAVVADIQFVWREGVLQQVANPLHAFGGHGSTARNGRTVTRSYTPSAK